MLGSCSMFHLAFFTVLADYDAKKSFFTMLADYDAKKSSFLCARALAAGATAQGAQRRRRARGDSATGRTRALGRREGVRGRSSARARSENAGSVRARGGCERRLSKTIKQRGVVGVCALLRVRELLGLREGARAFIKGLYSMCHVAFFTIHDGG